MSSSTGSQDRSAGIAFDKILSEEERVIAGQRRRRGLSPDPERLGLALSGGGIRSAAFALGVLQCFARRDELKHFDYLSTVSGGGYIGSALTWFNYLQREDPSPGFVFGEKSQVRQVSATRPQAETVTSPDNTAFLRQHGEFLTPSKKITSVSLLGVVLRNAIVSFSVYFALVLAAMLGVLQHQHFWKEHLPGGTLGEHVSTAWMPAVLLILFFIVLSILFGFFTWFFPKFRPDDTAMYSMRIAAQRVLGWVLAWIMAAVMIGSVPHVYDVLNDWTGFAIAATSTTGLGGLALEFIKQQRPRLVAAWPKLSGIAVWVGAFALIYAVLLVAYVVALDIDASRPPDAPRTIYLLLYALVVGGLMNSNLFSIGRMYRDRLMETFLPDPDSVTNRRWGPAHKADATFLQDVCGERDVGPYHLINANVVLTSTDYAAYRGRGGDNLIMSSLFCGSDALGWHPTTEFCGGKMSLATAMAISGAAVNPNAACGGRGPTRNRLASFMLALFNVRLGYWVRNPHARPGFASWVKLWWPNLLYPGLRQGLLGTGLHVRAGFIELTDGGHFDNTGLYELIRRRVPCMVLSLASADPDYGFDDLADVIQRVRVDFGAYIEFPSLFAATIPNADGAAGIAAALRLSKSAHAEGTVHYPDGTTGRLIVLKSALVSTLPLDVLRYAAKKRAFPNESTADQFFDERQFEAYREAGYSACHDMLRDRGVWRRPGV